MPIKKLSAILLTFALLVSVAAHAADNTATFFEAVARLDIDKVKTYLRDKKVKINAQDEDGNTALHIAAASGHEDIVELLIENGAAIPRKNKKGETAVQLARKNKHKDLAKLITARFRERVLRNAARLGNVDRVKNLIRRGVNVNATDRFGQGALHWAMIKGHKDVADLLIAAGADQDAMDKSGKAPLDHAKAAEPPAKAQGEPAPKGAKPAHQRKAYRGPLKATLAFVTAIGSKAKASTDWTKRHIVVGLLVSNGGKGTHRLPLAPRDLLWRTPQGVVDRARGFQIDTSKKSQTEAVARKRGQVSFFMTRWGRKEAQGAAVISGLIQVAVPRKDKFNLVLYFDIPTVREARTVEVKGLPSVQIPAQRMPK